MDDPVLNMYRDRNPRRYLALKSFFTGEQGFVPGSTVKFVFEDGSEIAVSRRDYLKIADTCLTNMYNLARWDGYEQKDYCGPRMNVPDFPLD